MSALWRINLLVTLFFALVGAVCLALLLRQAGQDVRRELLAAEAVAGYLRETALRDSSALQPHLTDSLRHVRVHRLDQPGVEPAPGPLQRWLAHWLYPAGGFVVARAISSANEFARKAALGPGLRCGFFL